MSEYGQILFSGVLIGFTLFVVVSNIRFIFGAINNSNGMVLNPLKKKDLCKQPHTWMKVYLNTVGFRDVNMCRICGYIAGSKLMASQEMIDRLEQLERKQKVQDDLLVEFSKTESNEITRWFEAEIKSGVDVNKIMDLHHAGQTFRERFQVYVLERQTDEMNKKDQ